MKMKHTLYTAALAATLLLTSCADKVSFEQAGLIEPVGFWHGLWHGMIIGIAFIVSLFDSDTTIYAIYNNGGWYNFGFWLGAVVLGSASFEISKKNRR